MPKLIRVADGIYRDDKGNLKHRPIINGRRTERKFVATTITKAREELAALRIAQLNVRLHGGADPYADPVFIGTLAAQWKDKNCPDRKDIPRQSAGLAAEKSKLERLLPFWKDKSADTISLKDCKQYYHWRIRQSKRYRLARSVDAELNTLSNLLNWAVSEELIRANAIATGRPKFDDPEKVRHCPEVMPPTDEVFHQYAGALLACARSRPLGWQFLIEGLTGCRTSEILACRLDAQELPGGKGEPGYYDGSRLHIKRGKKGIKNAVLVDGPLRECLLAFFAWHKKEYPKTAWFIPGRDSKQPARRTSLTHALRRISKAFDLPEVTSHGLRAYFVKVLRALGYPDEEISARLGHRSTQQVEQTYGEVESDWFGKRKMDFLPESGNPAWSPWIARVTERKIIPHPAYQKTTTIQTKDRIESKQLKSAGQAEVVDIKPQSTISKVF